MKKFKIFLAFLYDFIAIIFCWFMAYNLRFNFAIPSEHINIFTQSLLPNLLISIPIFYLNGLYKGIWRFASLIDLRKIIISVLLATLVLIVFLHMYKEIGIVPRSVLVIHPILLILLMGGSRFVYRSIKESQFLIPKSSLAQPVVILGSNQSSVSLIKELNRVGEWHVIGILNDDKRTHGQEICEVKILGFINELPKFKEKFAIQKAIIASADFSHVDRRRIIEDTSHLDIEVLIIPDMLDIVRGRLDLSHIRPLEVEDLLGRDNVDLDNSGLLNLIKNKVILISGAGGSIGSELCRQIEKFNPKTLICLDISEAALYRLEQEFLNLKFKKNIYVVADVKNKERLKDIFHKFTPDIVFHAAAYKHVPLMENHNVSEALINNAIGTYHLANTAKDFRVRKFILISTDKAVNPTNVMGASKHLSEIICRGLQLKSKTDFIITRFGNVLGSSGSVIPKFREQIALGGPITVTHPQMTRYFMSIPESAQLVLQATLIGKAGEIFVLDMGEPVKIVDLAKDMIKLSGFDEEEIEIKFTGLRAGEKLYEELLSENEVIKPTTHPKLKIATSNKISEKVLKDIVKWLCSTSTMTEMQIKKELKRWVKGYSNKDVKKALKNSNSLSRSI